MSYIPMGPTQIEEHLRSCISELTRAEKQLADARDVEVETEQEYQAAKRRALMSDDCPKVTRGSVTVADRDAFVEDRCQDEYRAYQLAHVALQAAQDHQRTVRDICSTYQTIASLCKASMSLAGAP